MQDHLFALRRSRIGAALVVVGALVASPAAAQVKIGFQAPLTGAAATDGGSARIASELAIERINGAGGVLGQKVELVTYDDQAKTEEAVFTANKLIGQDGVKFAVSGSYSASGRAAAPIFQKAGVPFISAYGVHPDITRSGDYVFRGVHLGPPQGRAAAKFLGDNLGLKRVSIVTMDNDYGQATFEGFKSATDQFGIKVLGEYTYSLKDRQFGSIVASVKRDNPDVIYVTGYFFTAAPLVTQLRSAGIRAPIVGSQAFDAEKLLEIAGPAVEGVYIVGGLNRDRDMPELKGCLAAFQNLAGELVSFNPLREINMPMNVNVVKDGKFRHHAWIDDLKLLAPPTE